jgi:pimeloyl-ACP methyl ester carboxylesterase
VGSPIGAFLRPPEFAGPQGIRALARESSAAVEAVRLVRRSRQDRRRRALLPYAGGHRQAALDPVLLVPGFMAGDSTLRLMAAFLRNEGFRTYRSQIHVNVGCTQQAVARLERRLESIAMRRERKVSLVGHSLGGLLARGLAARRGPSRGAAARRWGRRRSGSTARPRCPPARRAPRRPARACRRRGRGRQTSSSFHWGW